ncbi:MAG: DUF3099 domain-containing protein [Microbacterium sp.]|uniref:DUF3099 domain-containing protein n=1 Tax=Microbacterium sp. TaxID=51671 RepID=UPI0039E3152B
MKTSAQPQSATSLPRAPREDERARFVKYMAMMAVRIACFLLMVLVTPYGWYTWVFGAGAVVLPYIAVVIANVGEDVSSTGAESPERTLDGAVSPDAPRPDPAQPGVIRIHESPRTEESP